MTKDVRLLAAYQLGHRDHDEETREELHAAEPRLGGWHAAAQYLRTLALDRWRAEHPEDVGAFGYLARGP